MRLPLEWLHEYCDPGLDAHALADGLPTAGLVVIDFAENDWHKLAARSGRLAGFVTPRLLRPAED